MNEKVTLSFIEEAGLLAECPVIPAMVVKALRDVYDRESGRYQAFGDGYWHWE
jgi:hypothetical protein